MTAALLPLARPAMPTAPDAGPPRPLTPRQQQVAQLVASGFTNAEIAESLGCSPHTVKDHIDAIALRVPGPGALRARIIAHVLGHPPNGGRAVERSLTS